MDNRHEQQQIVVKRMSIVHSHHISVVQNSLQLPPVISSLRCNVGSLLGRSVIMVSWSWSYGQW